MIGDFVPLEETHYMIIYRPIMVAYHTMNVNWKPAFLPSMQQVKQTMVLLRSEDCNLVLGVNVRYTHGGFLRIEAVREMEEVGAKHVAWP